MPTNFHIMKKNIKLLLVLSLLFVLSSCALFRSEMTVVQQVPLKDVFEQVLGQYEKAVSEITSTDLKSHTLTITEADVAFDNVITNNESATLSLLIFKAGYTHSKKKETTVTYSLVSVPDDQKDHALMAKKSKNEDALKNLIVAAYRQFISVNGPKGEGKFEKDIEINISFTVDQSGSIEVSGPIGGFTPDVTLSRDVANTHSITLKFAIDKAK